MTTITLTTADGTDVQVPAKWEVCPRCQGDGTHDCWEGGMTGDEMAEQGPEFMDDYMNGVYSVACAACGGKRVIAVLDRARATAEQVRLHDRDEQDRADDEAVRRMEMAYSL